MDIRCRCAYEAPAGRGHCLALVLDARGEDHDHAIELREHVSEEIHD